MKKISREERKKALQERTTKNIENKDKKGFSGKRAIDYKGQEISWWKPKEGPNRIDILPYLVGTDHHPGKMKKGFEDYLLEYAVHYQVGPEEASYLCLKKMYGKPCAICQEQAALRQNENSDEDEIKSLNSQMRTAYNIIDLDDKEAGIQIFDVSHFLFELELLEKIEVFKQKEEVPTIFDIEEGYSIEFRAKGKKYKKSSYFEFKDFTFQERENPYSEDIFEETYALDEYLVIPTYEEVRNAFLGIEEDEEEDEPEEEEETKDEQPTKAKEEVTDDKSKRRERKRKKETKNKCPHDHVFGKDCDEHDECEECSQWNACADEQDRLDDES